MLSIKMSWDTTAGLVSDAIRHEITIEAESERHLVLLHSHSAFNGPVLASLTGDFRSTDIMRHICRRCCPDSGNIVFRAIMGGRTQSRLVQTLILAIMLVRSNTNASRCQMSCSVHLVFVIVLLLFLLCRLHTSTPTRLSTHVQQRLRFSPFFGYTL